MDDNEQQWLKGGASVQTKNEKWPKNHMKHWKKNSLAVIFSHQ